MVIISDVPTFFIVLAHTCTLWQCIFEDRRDGDKINADINTRWDLIDFSLRFSCKRFHVIFVEKLNRYISASIFIYVKIFHREIRRIRFRIYFKGIGSPQFPECSQILSFRKDDNVHAEEKVATLPLLHLFFSTIPPAIPDRSGLNCEGFARAKGLKDLYLMKNMVIHMYVARRYGHSIWYCCSVPTMLDREYPTRIRLCIIWIH